jgi:hypothetical protein
VEYIIAIVVVAGVLLVWLDRNGRRIIADETRAAQTRFTTQAPASTDFYLIEQEPETVETRRRSKR